LEALAAEGSLIEVSINVCKYVLRINEPLAKEAGVSVFPEDGKHVVIPGVNWLAVTCNHFLEIVQPPLIG